ncbi:hypothetical protein [Burkholderia mayonis]|uniref:Uncharacterized protein n=1 Tax=Burkholderia mayonis TaxID=1385591 RepID=A0A1B4G156_9BURK|nr:hypothetical protein [Burkholderia mayonis]AOJ09627.1 hypothetical protein WS71_20120 [Burkholderia mayonis]KVE52248.1 hypothetical protein WS71_09945 [Burkholderia mayonis]
MAGPKPFNDTLVQLRYGELHEELTDAINEVVMKVASTQKAGKITLTLAFKSGKGGQIEIADELKVTLPKEERGSTIMFATPEGNLQREDPRQKTFEGIRSVSDELQARKDAATDGALQPRVAAGGA